MLPGKISEVNGVKLSQELYRNCMFIGGFSAFPLYSSFLSFPPSFIISGEQEILLQAIILR